MYQIFAKFGKIDSLELYKLVEPYRLNVTEMVTETFMHGVIGVDSIDYINYICLKFGATSITIKKEPD